MSWALGPRRTGTGASHHTVHNLMNTAALRRLAATKRALVAAYPRPLAQRTYATNEKDPQLGDYPQFPPVHRALLPPKGWWDNQMRRNFGDIVSFFFKTLSF